ncbi:hypothetical protein ACF1GW_30880 [Streptomyces achromogenes]|uniref:hypothetical protein n=1 Tax=Streptomyces achromogenes TaxID=67255 RepID=UPI0036FB2A4B
MNQPTPAPGSAHYLLLALLDSYTAPQAKLDAYLAERLRVIADGLEVMSPDRSAEFSEGVDWVLARLRGTADELDGGAR